MSRKNTYSRMLQDRQLTDDAILRLLGHFCGELSNDDIDQLHLFMRLCYRRGLIDESIQQEYWHRKLSEEKA